MSLTFYPYTRKTWKKEVFEMLFDSQYFHVDSITLEYSKAIVDNLISNDRTMFKDVLSMLITFNTSQGLKRVTNFFFLENLPSSSDISAKRRFIHQQRARVRAEGSIVEATGLCYLL